MALAGQNIIVPPAAEYGTAGNLWIHRDGFNPAQSMTVASRTGAGLDGGDAPRWSTALDSRARTFWTLGPIAEGEYTLTIRITSTEAQAGKVDVFLGPMDPQDGAPFGYVRTLDPSSNPESGRVSIPRMSWETVTHTLTLQNRSSSAEIRDNYGTPDGTIDLAAADYALVIDSRGSSQNTAVSYVRLDVARTGGPSGYFDGDTPPADGIEYTWEGVAGDSLSLATDSTPAVIVIPAPAAERTDDGYMLPGVDGARWIVDGNETMPGTYSVQPVTETTTVVIVPEERDGWVFDPPDPDPLVLTFEPAPDPDPDPEPEPEPDPEPDPEPAPPISGDYPGPGGPEPAPDDPSPEDEALWARLMDDDPQAMFVATKLAERIIRHVGRDVADLDPSEVLTARDHAMVILEYVKGYTRDRGFIGYAPHRSLQAVIVAAGSRLFTNPEQVTYYATGDYSERPATMTGWTAAELGVLRRFRRVFA